MRKPLGWSAALAVLVGLACAAGPAASHGVGMSQLRLRVEGAHLEGDWDLHLRDARLALGLDTSLGGTVGWRDLQPHESELRALLARSLTIESDSLACPLELTAAPMEWNEATSSVRFHLVADCAKSPTRLRMHCDLLFDRDPTHRAYFSVEDARVTSVGAFHADQRTATFAVKQFHLVQVTLEFIRDGIGHIWSGLDHMLFLTSLLLPAPLLRAGRGWTPRAGIWPSTQEVLKVVTAFTVAHSLTLALSFFGLVRIREQWVEVGIALSVFAAAWNNLRPFLPGRAWVMAFGFGLVHGLGFAGALNNLSLPRNAHALALAAFNIGVEVGQLGVVAVVMPLIYAGSRRRWYPRIVMGLGSLGIAWVAVVWVLERTFTLSLFSRR